METARARVASALTLLVLAIAAVWWMKRPCLNDGQAGIVAQQTLRSFVAAHGGKGTFTLRTVSHRADHSRVYDFSADSGPAADVTVDVQCDGEAEARLAPALPGG